MVFACPRAGASGGATPVAASPTVLDALPADLVERFERAGWLLIRNYNDDIGASLADAFGTDDRGAVESYCRTHGIDFEWRPGGAFRPRHRRPALVPPPTTPPPASFNQVALLS